MSAKSAPRLEDWEKLDGDRYKGCVYGRQGFDDGTLITTGSVESRSGNRIKTFSGSVYVLGKPKAEAPPAARRAGAAAAHPAHPSGQRAAYGSGVSG